MVFRCYAFAPLLSLLIEGLSWIDEGSHEDGSRFALELDDNGRYIFVGGEGEDYSTGYEVEICVEGVGIVELDSHGHLEGLISRFWSERSPNSKIRILEVLEVGSSNADSGSRCMLILILQDALGLIGCE